MTEAARDGRPPDAAPGRRTRGRAPARARDRVGDRAPGRTRGRLVLAAIVAVHLGLAARASLELPLLEGPGEVAALDRARAWATGAWDRARDTATPLTDAAFGVGLRLAGAADLAWLARPATGTGFADSTLGGSLPTRDVRDASHSSAPDEARGPRWLHGADESAPWSTPVRRLHAVRLLGLLAGAALVLATHRLARAAVPDAPGLALGASALVAVHPAAAMGTGLVGPAALAAALATAGTAILWSATRRAAPVGWTAVLAGACLAAGHLALPAGAALIPAALVVLVLWRRDAAGALFVGVDRVLAGALAVLVPWWIASSGHGDVGATLSTSGRTFATAGIAALGDDLFAAFPQTRLGDAAGIGWALLVVGAAVLAWRSFRGRVHRDHAGASASTDAPRLTPRAIAVLAVAAIAPLAARAAGGLPWSGAAWIALPPLAVLLAAATARVTGPAAATLVLCVLAATTWQAQGRVLAQLAGPPIRADDPHFTLFDTLSSVESALDRRETLAWIAPAPGSTHGHGPSLRWEPAPDFAARYTVHVTAPSRGLRLRSYEDLGVTLRNRWTVPASFWDELPTGTRVELRVLRLPRRDALDATDRAPTPVTTSRALPVVCVRPEARL